MFALAIVTVTILPLTVAITVFPTLPAMNIYILYRGLWVRISNPAIPGVMSGKLMLATGFIQSTLWRGVAQCFDLDRQVICEKEINKPVSASSSLVTLPSSISSAFSTFASAFPTVEVAMLTLE